MKQSAIRISLSVSILLLALPVMLGAQDNQEAIKRVAQVSSKDGKRKFIVVTHQAKATVNITGENEKGQETLAPAVLASSPDAGMKVVVIDSATAKVNINKEDFPTVDIPPALVKPELEGVTVTQTSDGFSIKNDSAMPVAAIVETDDLKIPPTCVTIAAGQQANVTKGLLTVVKSGLAVQHSWVPAAGVQDLPKPPAPAEVTPKAPSIASNEYPQGWCFNTLSPAFMGVTGGGEWFFAQEVQMHVDPWVRQIPGFFIFDNFLEKDFNCFGGNVTCRLRTIDVTFGGGSGEFDGRGTQVHMTDPGGAITDVFEEFFDGNMWYIRASVFYPAFVVRADDFVARIGPEATYIFMQETVDSRNNGMGMSFDYHRRYEEHVYQLGGRVSLSWRGFSLEGTVGTFFGDMTDGLTGQLLIGYTVGN